ncbi:MAG: Hpt domain-containing protein [Rhodothalassiaceae bacterium]
MSEGGAEPVLDHRHLDACTEGDDALKREVLGIFARQVPDYLAAIEATRESDDESWRRAVHRLKGAARAVGARALAAEAAAAETAAQAARPAHLGALRASWERVAAEIASL